MFVIELSYKADLAEIDRNMAAHEPTKFTKDAAAVELMIDGIRLFIERTK